MKITFNNKREVVHDVSGFVLYCNGCEVELSDSCLKGVEFSGGEDIRFQFTCPHCHTELEEIYRYCDTIDI